MGLRGATQAILSSDKPAEWLKLADMYINSFNQMPEAFVLPAKHAILKPVIEAFHNDLETFVRYTQAIRDQLPPGEDKVDLQHFYRTLITRSVQQSRRARMNKALESVEKALGRTLDHEERERVAVRLERHWAMRRRELLKHARSATPSGRVSTDVQAEMLKEFWQEIDREIDNRELPIFNI
jgi:hypothetical protein